MTEVTLTVNGKKYTQDVFDHVLLADFIREKLKLTGTHIGCDTSQCGACVIHVDGKSIKSCTMLAVQADGRDVLTIEGLADGDMLHPMQRAFHENHGLQCGFCTPGMIMSAIELIKGKPDITEQEIRQGLEGNLCRCTGYQNIVKSIEGLADGDVLHPMQRAFHENHGLQCGFCTPGMIMSAIELIKGKPDITEQEIRQGLEGNLCRCTGYQNIVKSIQEAAKNENNLTNR